MTGLPAPSTPRGGQPTRQMAPDLAGLWVDLGRHSHPWTPSRGRWLRDPQARFRCRHGCTRHAAGAQPVTRLLADLAELHDHTCPLYYRGATDA